GSLLRIASEVGELDQDTYVRRRHILQRLLGLIGGCWAICSQIDPLHVNGSGWAVPNTITRAGKLSDYQQNVIDQYLTGQLDALDPCTPHLLKRQSPVVTFCRAEVVDRSWFRSDHFERVRRPLGFGESMYGKLTTPDGRCLKISLHREFSDAPFSDRHVQLLHVFNENLAGLYISPQRAGGPGPVDTLAPRLRPVLQRLLAGDSEKQAAMKLGLSPHTVHEYTKILYRTFAVNSRGELLAQFVCQGQVC
ncbi:MAG TPA: LuxR C-terminal-related transcriptional regulator, partial [Tepidisphaeraceae bacterium]|nr:LuxR C-terminal-related transcriptional regulator [Tepidisphaeraceae bacterium]